MERRIACIVRWLERFLSEYRSGSLENALMDAECARADIEHLRRDLWAKLENKQLRRPGRRMFFPLKVAFSVVLVLLATAAPLSTGQTVFSSLEPERLDREAFWAEETENWMGLSAFQNISPQPNDESVYEESATSDRLAVAGTSDVAAPVRVEPLAQVPRKDVVKNAPNRREKNVVGTTFQGTAISQERIFSLLQTGSKALKNEEPSIKVDRTGK